jgi:serine/threonine protein phosphatase 1
MLGHKITTNLNENTSNDIWISECKTKVGIDGGNGFKGCLHGILIDEDTLKVYYIDKSLNITTNTRNL